MAVFWVFVFPQADHLVCPLSGWFVSGTSPGVRTHTLGKTDLKVKASGRRKTHYGLELSLDFWPQGAFLVYHLSPKYRGSRDLLIFYSNRVLPFFVLAILSPWLLLWLLLLPFWRANRRLIVNSSTGAHLSGVSGKANRRLVFKYVIWSPLLPASWNANRRPVVNVKTGAHLSPTSHRLRKYN